MKFRERLMVRRSLHGIAALLAGRLASLSLVLFLIFVASELDRSYVGHGVNNGRVHMYVRTPA